MRVIRKNIYLFLSLGLFLIVHLLMNFHGAVVNNETFKVPVVCTLSHRANVEVPGGFEKKDHSPINKHKHQMQVHNAVDAKIAPVVADCIHNYSDASLAPIQALPHSYHYLFFSEINPPPPKNS